MTQEPSPKPSKLEKENKSKDDDLDEPLPERQCDNEETCESCQ